MLDNYPTDTPGADGDQPAPASDVTTRTVGFFYLTPDGKGRTGFVPNAELVQHEHVSDAPSRG